MCSVYHVKVVLVSISNYSMSNVIGFFLSRIEAIVGGGGEERRREERHKLSV